MWVPKKAPREQRAGTRPAPTVHKHREAVILSKAKNLKLSTLLFQLSTLIASLVGAQNKATAHWGLLPCFRGAPRSGEGYKKLGLKAPLKASAKGKRSFAALQDDKHRAPGTAPLF